jgi:hypothetical protein
VFTIIRRPKPRVPARRASRLHWHVPFDTVASVRGDLARLLDAVPRQARPIAADRQDDGYPGTLAHELRNRLARLVYDVAAVERLGAEPAGSAFVVRLPMA